MRPSLVVFLLLLVAAGALLGEALSAAGVALFLFLISCIDPKPAWRWQYDPPGHIDSGREGGRFLSWKRL